MRRFPLVAAFVLAACALAPAAPARAEHCTGGIVDSVATRLKAIEAEQPVSSDDYLKRSKELTTLLADPEAALWMKTQDTCASDGTTELQTVVRRRVLVLWGKMIALGAVDGPIFPAPYKRECGRFDGSSLQVDFIRAWLERLDDGGVGFSRSALWHALDDDAMYPHVLELAKDRAARLKITILPSLDSDEDAWLQSNETARARFAAALPTGTRCGTLYGLWGLEYGGAVNAPRPGAN
ncbi:MAG: hypothetical protein GIW95_01680 [Candidatus Eremiobacteraeota bacterium]|nr:hypothetical protein [Candidatus Eremiobacteraeota bacterium]